MPPPILRILSTLRDATRARRRPRVKTAKFLLPKNGVAKDFIAWGCIGLAAALGAWMWPFPRGLRGLSLNVAAAVFGAIGGAVLGGALGLMRSKGDPNALAFAAFGALTLLWFVHLVWGRLDRSTGHAHR